MYLHMAMVRHWYRVEGDDGGLMPSESAVLGVRMHRETVYTSTIAPSSILSEILGHSARTTQGDASRIERR